MAKPVSVGDIFHTGDERAAREFVMNAFDFRPRAIIDKLICCVPSIASRLTTDTGRLTSVKSSRRQQPSPSKVKE